MSTRRPPLVRRGMALEGVTVAWNVVGVAVLAWAAVRARSVALAGFGLDSLIEIAASAVVVWELAGTGERRRQAALGAIGAAFAVLAAYLVVQGAVALAVGHRAATSPAGIGWTAATAVVMLVLARGKTATGEALANQVLITEGRVTLVDGLLAAAVLAGLVLDTAAGWWWADPAAGFVLVAYAGREAWTAMRA